MKDDSPTYQESLNRVLVYLRANLDQELSLKELAGQANFSPYHFHRLFQAHLGEAVHQHVRRLRLERAAFRLSHSNEPITQIALAVGFETPAAFTKAFRQQFGMPPKEYRSGANVGIAAIAAPQPILAAPYRELEAQIRMVPEQEVLFITRRGPYPEASQAAWGQLLSYAYGQRLMRKDTKLIGIVHDSPHITHNDQLSYDAAVTVEEARPDGPFGVQTIPGGRYAVFLHRGPFETLHETYGFIFSVWLPRSNETLRDASCFETYLNRAPHRTKPANLRTEVWVPLRS